MPVAILVEELVLSVFHAVRMTYAREGRNLGAGQSLDEKMHEGVRRALASLNVPLRCQPESVMSPLRGEGEWDT
jgi:hypothetical protein